MRSNFGSGGTISPSPRSTIVAGSSLIVSVAATVFFLNPQENFIRLEKLMRSQIKQVIELVGDKLAEKSAQKLLPTISDDPTTIVDLGAVNRQYCERFSPTDDDMVQS